MNEKKRKMSDQSIAMIIRMWVAGMVCLFVAWTPIGGGELVEDAFIFQMIFMLSFFLFLTNLAVVNPVIRGMFKTRLDTQAYFKKPTLKRSLDHILHFMRMVLTTTLIWLSYVLINIILQAFGVELVDGKPIIMLEPITFGLLYGGLYFLIDKLLDTYDKKKLLKRNVS